MQQVKRDGLQIGGVAHMLLAVPKDELSKVVVKGMTPAVTGRDPVRNLRARIANTPNRDYMKYHVGRYERFMDELEKGLIPVEAFKHNAFVDQGLGGLLDSAYGDLSADRITHIGLSADTSEVTASTADLDPAGNGTGTSIKVTANTSRTDETVSTDQTWTQADVSWAIAKIGLLRGSASTDVSNIIGGEGGTSPYDEPFTIDLTNIATWTLTMGIDVTATAS